MTRWACGLAGCDAAFDSVEDAVVHQTIAHDRLECAVCGADLPDGYFAIRHAFDEHTRAEFVRAYDADSDDVRERERVKAEIEEAADLDSVVERVGDAV